MGFRSDFGLSRGEDDLKGGRGPGSAELAGDLCLPTPAEPAHEASCSSLPACPTRHPRPDPSRARAAPAALPSGTWWRGTRPASAALSPSPTNSLPQPPHEVWNCMGGPRGLVEARIGKGEDGTLGSGQSPQPPLSSRSGSVMEPPGHHPPVASCRRPLPAPGQGCALSWTRSPNASARSWWWSRSSKPSGRLLSHSGKWTAPSAALPCRLCLPGEPPTKWVGAPQGRLSAH